jgi:Enterochelin esterase and related enzymes
MVASRLVRFVVTAAAVCLAGGLSVARAASENGTGAPAPAEPQPPRREVKWNIPDGPPIRDVEHGVLQSKSMEREVGYNVYLPPGYKEGTKRYPVIYFLHGAGGTENSDAGGFSSLVRTEIEAKRIPPVICVFPNGGMSGYVDRPEQKVMGETLIIKELIPLIDSKYRTIASREGRVICGFSMGGGGAMRLAIKYPDLFSAAASWAGALGSRSGAPAAAGMKESVEKIAGKVRLLMIVGDQDQTFAAHAPFRQVLDEAKVPYTYRVLEGVGHNLGILYEKTGSEFVRFLAAGFGEPAATASASPAP